VQPNASTAAFQVASSSRWSRRRTIITTEAEFPGIAHVWLAQRVHGAEIVFVGRDGHVTAQDYLNAIDDRTALVSIPAVTYRDGRRLPVAEITAAAQAAGARVFVDAYQAAGTEPIDVTALNCDYLVAGTAKYLLGLPGVAFLYVRDHTTDTDQQPHLTGWQGRANPQDFDPVDMRYPATARRYETGTPAVPALFAAAAGLKLITSLELHDVRRHISGLVAYAAQHLLAAGEQLRLPDNPQERGAHLALLDHNADHLARWLAARGTIIAPRSGVARLAMHAYTTRADVDAVCAQILEYRTTTRRTGHRPPILAAR